MCLKISSTHTVDSLFGDTNEKTFLKLFSLLFFDQHGEPIQREDDGSIIRSSPNKKYVSNYACSNKLDMLNNYIDLPLLGHNINVVVVVSPFQSQTLELDENNFYNSNRNAVELDAIELASNLIYYGIHVYAKESHDIEFIEQHTTHPGCSSYILIDVVGHKKDFVAAGYVATAYACPIINPLTAVFTKVSINKEKVTQENILPFIHKAFLYSLGYNNITYVGEATIKAVKNLNWNIIWNGKYPSRQEIPERIAYEY